MRRADQVDQPLHHVEAIGDGQLRGGNAELAVVGGDAQIGLHGDAEPAAQAEAADSRDDRLGKRGELRPSDAGQPVVFLLGVGVRTVLLELADIGARDERLVARPAEDHHADRSILGELVEDIAQSRPHLHRHGVALLGLVEGDQPDAVVLRRQHLAAGVFAGDAAAW